MSTPSEAPVLALDGPGAAGKGTVAQAVAERLGWHYLESGALYRVLGWRAACDGIALDDRAALVRLSEALRLSFRAGRVFWGEREIGDEIRTEEAGARASKVAPLPEVRAALLTWQRRCARPPGLVAEGRDMGSVVFPHAVCKIFLTADAAARATRRARQLREKGFHVNMAELRAEIDARDRRDAQRAASPLRPAEDACVLDTTAQSSEQVIETVLARVRAALAG